MDKKKNLMVRSLLLILLLSPFMVVAQFTYVLDQSIPVTDTNGNPIPMPWAGGVNAGQHNTMDINGDGKIDLVVFDRMANKVLTYLNKGNQYLYAPEYESLFPDSVTNWILLRDFNCDGKKDIFTGDILGIKVYLNTTQPGGNLSWKQFIFYATDQNGNKKSNVLLTKGLSGFINLQLQYDDMPSIIDADGDGDLDIFNMKYTGYSSLEYHRNNSIELYGKCDSLSFERITSTWGGFTECGCGSFAFNGTDCPTTGGRVDHAGGKSVLMMDVDGDQDLDLLYSEATCNNLYLLKNDGTTENPVITTHSNYPASSPVNFYIFPAAFYEDVDFDGVPDLIATPNIYTKANLQSNLAASNWLYKNTGPRQLPSFVLSKTNFLQEDMIDVGDNSKPAFADYDGDGDLDLFISENLTPANRSSIYLFENTGTAELPSFKLITKDYLGFSQGNFYNVKIQLTDFNGDGNKDLIFTGTSAQNGITNLYYVINKGSINTLSFSGQTIQLVNLTLAYTENVCVADIDLDGKPDLLIGRSNGALEYWQNTGTLSFAKTNDGYLGLKTSILRQNPTCAIGDLNEDKLDDLILSDQTGVLTIISDFRSATDISGGVSETILSPLQDSTYTAHKLGGRLWPTVANIFNTNKPAIVTGNLLGGLYILKHSGARVITEEPSFSIYPNPVAQSNTLTIKLDRNSYLQIFSSLGQRVTEPSFIKGNEAHAYPISLARGVYIFRFTFDNTKPYAKRIVVY